MEFSLIFQDMTRTNGIALSLERRGFSRLIFHRDSIIAKDSREDD